VAVAPTVEDRVQALVEWLKRQQFGELELLDVEPEPFEDFDGEHGWRIRVRVEDPPPDAETWRVKDVAHLERAVRDKALELDVPWPWKIEIAGRTDDVSDLDDLDGDE
jgi:hypothetical protein